MIDAFANAIERLDRRLATERPDYYAKLRPGVAPSDLADFESRFDVQLPESFKSLYCWRDGRPDVVSEALYDNWMFRSLADVADTKRMLDEMIGSDFEDPRWWRRTWIPFLSNYGGDQLCLDLAGEDFGVPGQIITFWHDWEVRQAEHPSLQLWVQSFCDRYPMTKDE